MDRGRDLKVSFLSDTDQFNLDKPADDLDDLASAATDTGRQLDKLDKAATDTGRSLDKLDATAPAKDLDKLGADAKDAGQDLDKLGADAKATASQVDSAFDKIAASAKTKVADPVNEETHKAGESFAEFTSEAKANLSEVASSFSGDMSSAADLVQGTLGGIVGSLGPVGAAIGAVGAIGFGAINAQAQKTKERIREMFDALQEGGGKQTSDNVLSKLKEFESDGTLKKIRDEAKLTGVSFDDLKLAYAGDADALARVLPYLRKHQDALKDQAGQVDKQGNLLTDYGVALTETTNDLEDQNRVTAEATAQSKDYNDAVKNIKDSTTGLTPAQAEAKRRQDELNQSVEDAADAYDEAKSAAAGYLGTIGQGGQVEEDISSATLALTKSFKDNGNTLDINTEKGLANRGAARQLAQGYGELLSQMAENGASTDELTGKTQELRDKFIAQMTALTGNKEQAKAMADQFGLVPKEVKTNVTATGLDEQNTKARELREHLDYINGMNVNFVVNGHAVIPASITNLVNDLERGVVRSTP